jgi:ABC-type transporter lipoprotein component MlaA
MLPIFGPSNERDGLGLMADTSANPLIYMKIWPGCTVRFPGIN